MTSGIATPLGPCKRCEKAGVECMSNNVTSSNTLKRKDTNATNAASDSATGSKDDSSTTTSSSANYSSKASPLSSSERAPFSNLDTLLTDPALYMDGFDFDLGAVNGESVDRFAPSSAAIHDLPSPAQTHTNGSTTQIDNIERTRFSVVEDVGGNESGIFDVLNIPPTESLMWGNDHALTTTAEPMKRLDPPNSLMRTLNKLSELQTFIFKEFGHISKDDLATTFLSPEMSCHRSLGGHSQDKSLVEKVLSASECLIDILTSCGRNEVDSSSTSSPLRLPLGNINGTKRAQSDAFDDDELCRIDAPNSSPFGYSSRTADTMMTHLDFLRKNNASSSKGQPLTLPNRTSTTRFDTPIYSGLLSPAKLTLLVCYVSLLGVYRSIISQAFDIIRTPPPLSPPSRARTPKSGLLHSFAPTPQPHSSQFSGPTILKFRMQLEMLTHT